MRVERGGVVQGTGTGTVNEIETGSGTDTENVTRTVKGLESGMVEVVGMEDGEQIGGSGMEEMEAGIGTMIGVGHVPLSGMVTGGHLEVQFTHISGLCK